MIIPTTFKLGGIEVSVVKNDALISDHGFIGLCHYTEQQIVFDPSVSPDIAEQSFIHELVHWILYVMGEEELRKNEKFVEVFAQFLYQYIQTNRGNLRTTI